MVEDVEGGVAFAACVRNELVGSSGCDKLVNGGHMEMWKSPGEEEGEVKRNENRIGK